MSSSLSLSSSWERKRMILPNLYSFFWCSGGEFSSEPVRTNVSLTQNILFFFIFYKTKFYIYCTKLDYYLVPYMNSGVVFQWFHLFLDIFFSSTYLSSRVRSIPSKTIFWHQNIPSLPNLKPLLICSTKHIITKTPTLADSCQRPL